MSKAAALRNIISLGALEQFVHIGICEPVEPGDLISKADEKCLRLLSVVERGDESCSILTDYGREVFKFLFRVADREYSAAPNIPLTETEKESILKRVMNPEVSSND